MSGGINIAQWRPQYRTDKMAAEYILNCVPDKMAAEYISNCVPDKMAAEDILNCVPDKMAAEYILNCVPDKMAAEYVLNCVHIKWNKFAKTHRGEIISCQAITFFIISVLDTPA